MQTKRFIAGAVCPQCQVVDRLVVEQADGVTRRRCVSCGFSDDQGLTTTVSVSTRFVARGPGDVDAQPIKLIDD
ncbi:MAG: YheV family putative metal-binding protein [Gammaproteobacteria bacterium]|nr:YheV family putative metal-binding protein [Gammaproteobacteria bacterium]